MASQATKAIKAQRINQVVTMLQQGMYRWEIVNQLSKEWQCSERNVERYMEASYKLLSIHYDKDVLENILSKYDMLYKRSINSGDNKLAVRILDSIAIVKGLKVNKSDITSGGEKINPVNINFINPNGK